MPYYGDGVPSYNYYGGGSPFTNHSSLMTSVGRYYSPIAARYSPHLSTISESPSFGHHRRRHGPSSSSSSSLTTSSTNGTAAFARPRRVIDTADIDVSKPPRNYAHHHNNNNQQHHQGHRLRRDRPTIKIRSQALKDNPALREYNERHEKTVGELLVEKFLIKDKQEQQQQLEQKPAERKMRLYHQASLLRPPDADDVISKDEDEDLLAAMRRRVTRRMTRRRSSADVIPLNPEQIEREAALLAAQAEALDNLVAEEQAEIEVEVRRGTFAKRQAMRLPLEISEVSETEDEGEHQSGTTTMTNSTTMKKKKRRKIDKPREADEQGSEEDEVDEVILEIPESVLEVDEEEEEPFEWDDRKKCDDLSDIVPEKDEVIIKINDIVATKSKGIRRFSEETYKDKIPVVTTTMTTTDGNIETEYKIEEQKPVVMRAPRKLSLEIIDEKIQETQKELKNLICKEKRFPELKRREKMLKLDEVKEKEPVVISEVEKEKEDIVTISKEKKVTKVTKNKELDTPKLKLKSDKQQLEVKIETEQNKKEEENDLAVPRFKVEACNSVGDFSTLYVKAATNQTTVEPVSKIEHYRESVRLPAPPSVHQQQKSKVNNTETEVVVLPVRKPYVLDEKRNSVYLALKPINQQQQKKETIEREGPPSVVIDKATRKKSDRSESRPNANEDAKHHRSKIESRDYVDDIITIGKKGEAADEKSVGAATTVNVSSSLIEETTDKKRSGGGGGKEEFVAWWDETPATATTTKELEDKGVTKRKALEKSTIPTTVGAIGDKGQKKTAEEKVKVKAEVDDKKNTLSAAATSDLPKSLTQKVGGRNEVKTSAGGESEKKSLTEKKDSELKSVLKKEVKPEEKTKVSDTSKKLSIDKPTSVAELINLPQKLSSDKPKSPAEEVQGAKPEEKPKLGDLSKKSLNDKPKSPAEKIRSGKPEDNKVVEVTQEKSKEEIIVDKIPVVKIEIEGSKPSDKKTEAKDKLLTKSLQDNKTKTEPKEVAAKSVDKKVESNKDVELKLKPLDKKPVDKKDKTEKTKAEAQKKPSSPSKLSSSDKEKPKEKSQLTSHRSEKKPRSESPRFDRPLFDIPEEIITSPTEQRSTETITSKTNDNKSPLAKLENKSEQQKQLLSESAAKKSEQPTIAAGISVKDDKRKKLVNAAAIMKIEKKILEDSDSIRSGVIPEAQQQHLGGGMAADAAGTEVDFWSEIGAPQSSVRFSGKKHLLLQNHSFDSRKSLKLELSKPPPASEEEELPTPVVAPTDEGEETTPIVSQPATPSVPLSESRGSSVIYCNGETDRTGTVKKISKWGNHDNLSNLNDIDGDVTPVIASMEPSPQVSAASSTTTKKRIVKKKKSVSSSTKKSSDGGSKTTSTKKGTKKKTSASNTPLSTLKTGPMSAAGSPRNTPSQRPADLNKLFYTTPAILLTATPRDLRKVRRAKVKRKKPSTRTPSLSSDSTGSTRSTTNTSTEEGSSNCEEDAEHKRLASTRSNDSGFDGSPRLSNCDMVCHKKCEKLTGNLCGLNQKLVAEALQALKKGPSYTRTGRKSFVRRRLRPYGYVEPQQQQQQQPTAPSQSSENQRNADSDHFHHSGRITPPATNLPRFKKYEVTDFNFLKVLGKGSFGKVLLAELRGTECVYAVKCLKKDVVLEDDDVECTLIERKVLTLATRHPYLCHLFCTFQTESHLFFVMEYLNGGDLMFHIQKSGRFSEARARFYAAEIWSGLIFLHKKGIVYRDLKLDNVLLDFEGHIRIADFGMCKLQIFLDRTADTFCGTPDYMAPEIIKGLKYNQAVDWWSFGVLLYEMLTGQSPFSGCDEDELFWSICNERPFIPRYLCQSATELLVCLLEKDAGKRIPGHEIACHSFFNAISWEKLERRTLEPPFKPAVEHTLDTRYFDTAFTTERPRLTAVPEQILSSMDQSVFRGFSYTNPNATD